MLRLRELISKDTLLRLYKALIYYATLTIVRESQCDWFAKPSIPWHITVAFTRSEANAPLEKLTFVHLFQSCPQDSVSVTAILQDVIETLKKHRP